MTERTTHINLDGNKGVCSSPYNCPFSDPDQHYADEQEAQKAFEDLMDEHNAVFGEYPREKMSMRDMRNKVRDEKKAASAKAALEKEERELEQLKRSAQRRGVSNDLSRFVVERHRDIYTFDTEHWQKDIRSRDTEILSVIGRGDELSGAAHKAVRGNSVYVDTVLGQRAVNRVATNVINSLNRIAVESKFGSRKLVEEMRQSGYYSKFNQADSILLERDANTGHLVALASEAEISPSTWDKLTDRFMKTGSVKDTIIVAAAHPDPLIRSQASDTLSQVFPETMKKDDVLALTEGISYLQQRDQAAIASQIEYHVERSFNPMEMEEFNDMRARWYSPDLLVATKLKDKKPKKSFMMKMLGR